MPKHLYVDKTVWLARKSTRKTKCSLPFCQYVSAEFEPSTSHNVFGCRQWNKFSQVVTSIFFQRVLPLKKYQHQKEIAVQCPHHVTKVIVS